MNPPTLRYTIKPPTLLSRAMAIANNPGGMMLLLYEKALEADGNILEIGTHKGASALLFMEAMHNTESDGMLVTVDPWGGRPYPGSDSRYGDHDQREAMAILSEQAWKWKLNWHHFKMASLDFLARLQSTECWYDGEKYPYRWALAFLDGEHIFDSVSAEIIALKDAMEPGGVILIDNADHVQPHAADKMEPMIQELAESLGMECIFHRFHLDMVAELRCPA